jgi:hypothetical protein
MLTLNKIESFSSYFYFYYTLANIHKNTNFFIHFAFVLISGNNIQLIDTHKKPPFFMEIVVIKLVEGYVGVDINSILN